MCLPAAAARFWFSLEEVKRFFTNSGEFADRGCDAGGGGALRRELGGAGTSAIRFRW